VAALHRTGFDALLVFYYTVTAINELREPLHDEVASRVFRVVGERLEPVEQGFERDVLRSEFLPIKSPSHRDDWVKAFRGRWFPHRSGIEAFLGEREATLSGVMQARADAALKREADSARESYRYRLKELQDRSREQELEKLVKQLVREKSELEQPTLFEEFREDSKAKLQEIEEQMTVLRQDVDRTRGQLTRERDNRLNVVLPKRFRVREVRVLPLALTYLVPATAEDLRS
jgi:hypothetical protein